MPSGGLVEPLNGFPAVIFFLIIEVAGQTSKRKICLTHPE